MLKQRILTALIMAGLFLAGVFYLPQPALAAVFALLVVLGGWEWSRLAGWRSPVSRGLFLLVLMTVMAVLYVYCSLASEPPREHIQPVLGLACLWWSFALLWVKSYPASATLWNNRFMCSLIGLLVLAPAWAAAVYLLSFPQGSLLLVVMVLIVAVADIGAYFTGKTLGRHKMAPAVSPAKTWEGFWGGVASVLVAGVLLWYLLPARGDHISLLAVFAVVLSTSMASVVGDLSVSMVKRECGCKDSGNLLPGHGGLLDRLDSLCGAAPVFALGVLLAGW
ncbi:phosphatidate cytidylyltransferase [Haliea sp. E17]|uniref:phosphatidate cytidylyltransferase n=1 Tax=Haliea sp. E17 TaxID=3401576 RepID=UPI003AAE1ADA